MLVLGLSPRTVFVLSIDGREVCRFQVEERAMGTSRVKLDLLPEVRVTREDGVMERGRLDGRRVGAVDGGVSQP